MQILGFIPLALGLLIVALGCLYGYLEYSFGFAVWFLSLMWGIASIGLGLALLGTTDRRLASAGVLSCVISFALMACWHLHTAPIDAEWAWGLWLPNTLGILYGTTAVVLKTVRIRRGGASN